MFQFYDKTFCCRYSVESDKTQPGLINLSFRAAQRISQIQEAALRATYEGYAKLRRASDWQELHLEVCFLTDMNLFKYNLKVKAAGLREVHRYHAHLLK